MTEQEQEIAKQMLSKNYLEQKDACESPFEVKMLDAQYKKDVEKVEAGINPFDKPENSGYECFGCGS